MMKFAEAFQAINELAVYGRVHALASHKRLAEAQQVVDAEFRRLRKVEAAAREVIAGEMPHECWHEELREALREAQ
jgi:hypothetical protein